MTVERVLSVGCGAGNTEAELVARGVDVVGIEINHEAVVAARARGLVVLEGDVNHLTTQLVGRSFDCLIYADVLEHLMDPVSVLRAHAANLDPQGIVIISVPNFRHYSVLWQLVVRGWIQYTESGILDRTHVRVTTRRMAVDWIRQAGLIPTRRQYVLARRRDQLLSTLSLGLAKELLAQQIIVVAMKPDERGSGGSVLTASGRIKATNVPPAQQAIGAR